MKGLDAKQWHTGGLDVSENTTKLAKVQEILNELYSSRNFLVLVHVPIIVRRGGEVNPDNRRKKKLLCLSLHTKAFQGILTDFLNKFCNQYFITFMRYLGKIHT